MKPWMISALLALGGVAFFVRNVGFLRDENKLRRYLQQSPKARLWTASLGLERTVELSKKYFLPLGLIASGAMAVAGAGGILRAL